MSNSSAVKERPASPVSIEREMERSYLDYAMSVIVSRALPDVRDGLKPAQRRILYAMREAGYVADKPHRKSARIVGDVMGKYHPHGGDALYETMVRMAQPFSLRLPLIDGQGNFGSLDGDPPAAMRYTEARLAAAAAPLLEDIDADTVDFQDNYDGSAREPVILPAAYPNMLVNGAGGIAVGMATNIPPHNPGEVIDAACALLDDPDLGDDSLRAILPGPDFPTGGIILGGEGLLSIFASGRGSLVLRGRAAIEDLRGGRQAVVISEIPYQVNKARLIERIAALARDKTLEGVTDLRDESDRRGLRIVMELRRNLSAEILLNRLYRLTPLQTNVGVHLLALHNGRPQLFTIRQALLAFIAFREEVIRRRTVHQLNKTRRRAHQLTGLAIAVANLDAVIGLIRAAKDSAAASQALLARPWPAADMAPFIAALDDPRYRIQDDGALRLSASQARAILELRLHRLTALERDKISADLQTAVTEIKKCLAILSDRKLLRDQLRRELVALRAPLASPRRTEIGDARRDLDDEDLIQAEDVVITLSRNGYVKRTLRSAYRAQKRGGKGRTGMKTREFDFITAVYDANTLTSLLFLTSQGRAYRLKAWRLPQSAQGARGRPLVNLLPLRRAETVSALMPLPAPDAPTPGALMLATSSGYVRRNRLEDFAAVNIAGKMAMRLKGGERLVGAQLCRDDDDVLLVTAAGRAIRFPADEVRIFAGRESTGVRGVLLDEGDEVISMAILRRSAFSPEQREAWFRIHLEASGERLSPEIEKAMREEQELLFTITDDGYGKCTSSHDYRLTGRGGKGIIHMAASEGARLAASFPVKREDDVIVAASSGLTLRCSVKEINLMRRPARGLRVVSLAAGEKVVSAALFAEGQGDAS